MSYLASKPEQNDDNEVALLQSLNSLAISGASQAIRKTSSTTVANVDLGGGGHTIQDEGISLTQRTKLNFKGTAVTVTDGGVGTDDTIITITGGDLGPGTINEIAYFDSATTIKSLPVATYPSLTELSYVKGATSNIQTQINNIPALSVATGAEIDTGTDNVKYASAKALRDSKHIQAAICGGNLYCFFNFV